jgi:hemerythrin
MPEQAVHVPAIDAEHQELFRVAADLRQALLNGHFSHEERLMRDAEYPAYTWHERQHRTARARMAALERDFQRSDRQGMFKSLEALAGWVRDHTSVADRMAGSYLRNYWRAREYAPL